MYLFLMLIFFSVTGSLQKSVVLADLADDFVFDMEDDDERADALGRRFLNAARENNHIRMSLLLQKGADIDYTDDASNNALLLYCQHDDMDNDMFYDLLSDETSINFDSDNYCALHHLCLNGGHRFYVEALLEKIEKQCKDVGYSDFIDDDENSPLSYAIENSMGGVCLQLLRMGADVSQLNSYEENSLKDLVFKQILHEAEEVRNKKKKCEENSDDDESNNDEEEEESNEEEEEGDDDESDEDKGSEQSDSYEYNEVYCVSSGSE